MYAIEPSLYSEFPYSLKPSITIGRFRLLSPYSSGSSLLTRLEVRRLGTVYLGLNSSIALSSPIFIGLCSALLVGSIVFVGLFSGPLNSSLLSSSSIISITLEEVVGLLVL
jgi:hypothetical protein